MFYFLEKKMNLVLGWNLGAFLSLLLDFFKKKVKEVDLVLQGFLLNIFEILCFK
jgi:hypothetical protein